MTYSHNTTAFALSLTFDLASIRFKVRPFKLLRTPSPHDHLPHLPLFCVLSKQSRRFLLGIEQHNKRRLLLHRVRVLQLPFCCLFLRRADGLSFFVQLHRIKIRSLRFQLSIFSQRLIQLGGIFLFLCFQLFQASFHGGNILAECLCACILRILKSLQKERLFGTQFL